MKIGDLIHPWPNEGDVGLVIDIIYDQWSSRYVVLSEGEIFEIPYHQVGESDADR